LKILLVDDHAVVREGVRRLLANTIDAEIIDAESSEAAQHALRTHNPTLVVLDLNLPGGGGLDLLRRLLAEAPRLRVLIFSMHSSPAYIMRAMQGGAAGYVTKSASADELVEAVRKVAEGGRYLQRDLITDLASSDVWSRGAKQPLSTKELDILRLLAQGKTLSEIAAELGSSYKTIANTCTSLKDKLLAESSSDLRRIAVEMHAAWSKC
jgi:two-component system invasion response regulator UvrY